MSKKASNPNPPKGVRPPAPPGPPKPGHGGKREGSGRTLTTRKTVSYRIDADIELAVKAAAAEDGYRWPSDWMNVLLTRVLKGRRLIK